MLVPKNKAIASIEVKKSKFIAIAEKVSSDSEAHEKIIKTRSDYPDASHVVYAFIIGKQGDIFGMSDDREPRGTAGRPALEVLKGSGITDIIVMVVRYFGGTKLGTGGLVKAYTEAVQNVLKILETEELVSKKKFTVILPYELYDSIKKILEEHSAEIDSEKFETNVEIKGIIPSSEFTEADARIITLSRGRIRLSENQNN